MRHKNPVVLMDAITTIDVTNIIEIFLITLDESINSIEAAIAQVETAKLFGSLMMPV
tara:strand:- start:36 stop:206 length:171 start_codon:yes stop_codon:yes gene_type:complete